MKIIYTSKMNKIKLSLLSGYVFVSILFVGCMFSTSNRYLTTNIYLLIFFLVGLIVYLYLSQSNMTVDELYFSFYCKPFFVKRYRRKVFIKDIISVIPNYHDNKFHYLNFLSIRFDGEIYRIPIGQYNKNEVEELIKTINYLKNH